MKNHSLVDNLPSKSTGDFLTSIEFNALADYIRSLNFDSMSSILRILNNLSSATDTVFKGTADPSSATPQSPNDKDAYLAIDSGDIFGVVGVVKNQVVVYRTNTWVAEDFEVSPASISSLLNSLTGLDRIQSGAISYGDKTVKETLDSLLQVSNGDILVTVMDGTRPLPNIPIKIIDENDVEISLTTDSAGEVLHTVDSGKYTVQVLPTGYDIVDMSIITDNNISDNSGRIGDKIGNIDVGAFRAEVSISLTPVQAPVLNSFLINNGDADSGSSNLTLNLGTSGIVYEYMVSQSASFFGATWKSFTSSDIPFTFNYTSDVTLTLYMKVRNSAGESGVLSDSINMQNAISRSDVATKYNSLASCLAAIKADYGDNLTQDVTVLVAYATTLSSSSIYLTDMEYFNNESDYMLTIDGDNLLTVDCGTGGGFKFTEVSNLMIKDINFTNVSSYKEKGSPDQLAGLFIQGGINVKVKNIVITGCTINGRYSDTSWGRYGIVLKNIENATVNNTTIERIGARVIQVRDTTSISFNNLTIQDCPVVRGIVSQPAGIDMLNVDYTDVNDSKLDFAGNDTTMIIGNSKYLYIKRTELINADSEVFRISATREFVTFHVERCVFDNNIANPIYPWTKNICGVNSVTNMTWINNTIRLTAVGGYQYYARVISAGSIGTFTFVNNIVDYYFPALADNQSNAWMILYESMNTLVAHNNVYRDNLISPTEIRNYIYDCSDSSSPVYMNNLDDLVDIQALGYETDTLLVDYLDPLFTSEFDQLEASVAANPVDATVLPIYDKDKNINDGVANPGAYWQTAIAVTPSTTYGFEGIDSFDNSLYDNSSVNEIVYSGETQILIPNFTDKHAVFEWLLDNGTFQYRVFGSSVCVKPISQQDGSGNYIDDHTYSITIDKTSL
jgi:hypothetical protein